VPLRESDEAIGTRLLVVPPVRLVGLGCEELRIGALQDLLEGCRCIEA
jgi:hypothetical protein